MKALLYNWNLMRFVRLAIGIYGVVQAILQEDVMIGALGGFLLVTALANIAGCGAGGCAINSRPAKRNQTVQFEELESKK